MTTLIFSTIVLWIILGALVFVDFYAAHDGREFLSSLLVDTRLGSYGPS